MVRKFAIGVCVALSLAVAMPSAATAAKENAKVSVLGWFTAGPGGIWQIRVKSDVNRCQKERFVEFYKRNGEDNVLLGSGDTERQGSGRWIWELGSFMPENANYFALAPPTAKCKRSESKIFTYPDDN